MRSPEPEQQAERETLRVHQRMKVLMTLAVLAMHAMVAVHVWGHWRQIALLSASVVVTAPLVLLLSHREFLNQTHTAENLRTLIGIAGTLVYGHFANWYFPIWVLCVLNPLWADSTLDTAGRVRVYGSFALVVLGALLDGAPLEVTLGMLILSVVILMMSRARLSVLRKTSERLEQRRDELQRALTELERVHRRSREQERLSSLGLLAAGIAHEVNNPMSYVKSNLCALQQDLQALEELPPSLREYATEVLPQTLEGVQRVCAIVADLRRFARGDPEALVEYDLNEEVRTALRITQSRLKAHCEVEVALAPLPVMLGHPREISQVVVNLLLNAAQAMKQRGQVRVSTWTEGEDHVVLTVRDSGEGMGSEVLAHLFQPFFTTRQTGEGTGLGLAAVHGIVTAHGGHIRVESTPTQGSTFTVRLPRVPPLKLVAPRAVDAPAPEDPSPGRPRLH